MSHYVFDKFSGGLADFNHKGVEGAFKFGKNLSIRRQADSLFCQQTTLDEGLITSASPSLSVSPSLSKSASPSLSASASPSPTPSPSSSVSPSASLSPSPSPTPSASISPSPSLSAEVTSVFRDLIKFFVKASDGYTYGFGSAGYIYRRDADAFWQRVYKDPDGEIKGASEWFSSSGKAYLYWATNTTLHRKELPGQSDWNDVDADAGWPKQDLTPSDYHTMTEVGGTLLICNGPKMAYVNYNDYYTPDAVHLFESKLAKTLIERNNKAIIGTYSATDTGKGINGLIDAEIPLAQVGDEGQIFYGDMNDSVPMKALPGGGQVNPGGVTTLIEQSSLLSWDLMGPEEEPEVTAITDVKTINNIALFAVYGADTGRGGIYSFGRKNKNHPFVLNLDYQIDADELGAVAVVDGTVMFSYQDGTEPGVKAVRQDYKATAYYESLEVPPNIKNKPSEIPVWKYAEVFCEPLPDGSNIAFQYKLNKTGDFITATNERGDSTFTAREETKAVFNIGETADIFEYRIILTPTGNSSPEVHRVKVFFD